MFKNGSSYIISIIFIIGLCAIYLLTVYGGSIPTLLFACLPLLVLVTAKFSQKQYYFYAFFIINYIISGINRYIPLKIGIIMLGLTTGIGCLLLIKNIFQTYEWKRSANLLTILWAIWFLYCLFELFNPLAVPDAWLIAITGYAFPLISALIIPVLFIRFKDFHWLLIIWAILSILAALKGYWQKSHGFDSAELKWLFVDGGARTHIIYTGIRYFSFLSDAANFGITMGLSMTIFGISGFFVKTRWVKYLFWSAAFASTYGLLISGTRSAVVVPIVGLGIYTLLCRNIKNLFFAGSILFVVILFLTQTNIGNSNSLIRRVRSAFNKEDASFKIRGINKAKMIPLMKDKPFGVGLGLSGGRMERFNIDSKLSKLPPDSLLTMYWLETGIIGLSLYLSLLVIIFVRASYIAMVIVKDKRLKNILFSIIAGLAGVFVAAYANDITTYPNGIIISILFVFLFIAPYYDKELTPNEPST
ncbi:MULTISPECIES: O-antigen ligase family protein [Butyricimonas]|uniref:O-antigen ligase family protein n=1 Tax=Butyricimonas TaxID=574697 RepID=UPI001D0655C2|nr:MULTISPECIES: O-antigen ligase family protein [Butyricimonas]MCB6972376.1 O-antigen ligase family protein [Butyricimonas synergistica]MCG4519384.1 O-antigen ligase family protein [Butyricimonas sp. DFI.6.44]